MRPGLIILGFVLLLPVTGGAAERVQRVGFNSTSGYGNAAFIPIPIGQVTQVATYDNSVIVLKTDGTVACWGSDEDGISMVPAGLTGVTHVAMGASHAVAAAGATVVTWGKPSAAHAVPTLASPVVDLAAGTSFSCAVLADGSLVVWLLDGTVDAGRARSGAAEVDAYWDNVVVRYLDGTVESWGVNIGAAPVGLDEVAQVAISSNVAIARKTDGTVVCWGGGGFGSTDVPPGLSGVIQVSAGQDRSMAVRSDGTVVEWGHFGLSGPAPLHVGQVISLDLGSRNGIAVRSDNSLLTWGRDLDGASVNPDDLGPIQQVGTVGTSGTILLGNHRVKGLSTEVEATESTVVMVQGALALRSDGTVFSVGSTISTAWAAAVDGVVGGDAHISDTLFVLRDGTVRQWSGSSEVSIPVTLSAIRQVAIGAGQFLALGYDGTVTGWGADTYGEATPPVGLTDVVAIAAGYHVSAALKSDGSVVVWGENPDGRFDIPVGLGPVREIAAGRRIMALLQDGTIETWGPPFPAVDHFPTDVADGQSISADPNGIYTFHEKAATPVSVAVDVTGGQTDPLPGISAKFAVVFSAPIDPATLIPGDFQVYATTGGAAQVVSLTTADNQTWEATVGGMAATDGTIRISLPSYRVLTPAGGVNTRSTSTTATIAWTAPPGGGGGSSDGDSSGCGSGSGLQAIGLLLVVLLGFRRRLRHLR